MYAASQCRYARQINFESDFITVSITLVVFYLLHKTIPKPKTKSQFWHGQYNKAIIKIDD